MSTFEETVRNWREASFPQGSEVDALDDIHADLALYDSWIAESVVPYVDRGIWEPAVVDVLGALDELILRTKALQRTGIDDRSAAASYLAYAEMLRRVYRAFLQKRQSP